jgi:hypothetical protein
MGNSLESQSIEVTFIQVQISTCAYALVSVVEESSTYSNSKPNIKASYVVPPIHPQPNAHLHSLPPTLFSAELPSTSDT